MDGLAQTFRKAHIIIHPPTPRKPAPNPCVPETPPEISPAHRAGYCLHSTSVPEGRRKRTIYPDLLDLLGLLIPTQLRTSKIRNPAIT